MTKTVVIIQSNYIPWRGYFDLLRSADEVVLLDSVQYTRRDWRNRNQIKSSSGLTWLTIPVEVKGRYDQAIDETRIADPYWAAKHINSIKSSYARAAHYHSVAPWLLDLLKSIASEPLLSNVNEFLIRAVCSYLEIYVPIRRCAELIDRGTSPQMEPTERLVAIALAANATHYLSGPAAKAYLDTGCFNASGLEVLWMDYRGYPEYQQMWGQFEPHVSIVDLLLNVGADASRYLVRKVN